VLNAYKISRFSATGSLCLGTGTRQTYSYNRYYLEVVYALSAGCRLAFGDLPIWPTVREIFIQIDKSILLEAMQEIKRVRFN